MFFFDFYNQTYKIYLICFFFGRLPGNTQSIAAVTGLCVGSVPTIVRDSLRFTPAPLPSLSQSPKPWRRRFAIVHCHFNFLSLIIYFGEGLRHAPMLKLRRKHKASTDGEGDSQSYTVTLTFSR